MPELNTDFPNTVALIRDEYLYDLHDGHGDFTPVYVFGLTSIEGRALMFLVMTDGGAIRDHVPISAITSEKHPQHMPLDNHELWNSFSYHVAVHEFSFLKGLRCQVKLRDKSVHWGTYVATADWYGNRISEDPGEGGHKSAHVVQLDCGCWVAQPNHRVLWRESSFVTKPLSWSGPLPPYKTNTHKWNVEQNPKWVTSDDDRWFYEGEEKS